MTNQTNAQDTLTALLASHGVRLVSDEQVLFRAGWDDGAHIVRVVVYDVNGRKYEQRHWHNQGMLVRVDGGFIS